MLKIDFTEKAIDEVYEQFMEHPSGLIKKKLHVVYLKAQGVAHKEIERIARTSADYNGQLKQDTLLSRFLIEFPFIFERGLIAYF